MMKKEKKTNGVQLLIRAVVRDPDGKIITDAGEKPSRSFLIQFLEFIGAVFDGLDTSATASDGTEDPIYVGAVSSQWLFGMQDIAGSSLFGVQVGTGYTPVDNTDYVLVTQLTEGTGAGNISHGASVVEDTAVVGANVDLEVKRAFTNGTGSTITVKEAGMMARYKYSPYGLHLIVRDVLSPAVDVPDKCSLTVIYTLRTTV